MNKPLSRLLIAALVPVVLSGCVVAIGADEVDRRDKWAEIERENRDAITSLDPGMARAEVEARMPHPPALSEAFTIEDSVYTVLFYRTQRVDGDGRTTRDETTPLIFRNGVLDAWGESAFVQLTGMPLSGGR
ncbi:DUF3192 domain-containing protein [Wenzhouxiangella sp. XN79A]|uniref:DUF3192 domain-containing protein n=1 Tax=Wenzhouxiangella sp. XN79A TaxID=2724193 RepID=UPI00144A827E|nr:DUF3192 domain-containing protein [Wenzhouxiangella sp. XN79A]NKI36551.1 DUF3192 domain-containing protein [Wenzhouxiangella sp. XN79A]